MPIRPILPLLLLLAAAPAAAQQADTAIRIPAPHGEAVMLGEREKAFSYDDWHFSSVRVADGVAYVSGVVVGARDTTPLDPAGFEAASLRVFRRIEQYLRAVGAGPEDIVMINTFHVFGSRWFAGSKTEHFDAFRRAKDQVVPAPYPAWTAVGVTELLPERGLVEVQVIAHLPRGAEAGRPAPR
jgi:enamine deaminase RidA (YjgF/YER057c/UK114 family)